LCGRNGGPLSRLRCRYYRDTGTRRCHEAATRTLAAGDAAMGADVDSALRHLLALPFLREAAVKASRVKSLAISATNAAS